MASPSTPGTPKPQASQYFDETPDAASRRQQIRLDLPDLGFELTTDRGVFSADRVDAGSKLLLMEGPPAVPSDRVLVDVGAGYGPIALTLATRNPEAQVFAVEVNQRARDLCRHNAEALGLSNVEVCAPVDFPAAIRIDRIWSNPPIRIGKAALHQLLLLWLGRLSDDGSAHLVVQKHLGADSLQRWLIQQGHPTERRSSRKSYRLLDVSRHEHRDEGES